MKAVIQGADDSVWQALDRSPFVFQHALAGHPLFEVPRLARLARRFSARADKYGSAGDSARPLHEQLYQLEDGQHWLKLSYANEIDADYAELLRGFIAEVEQRAGLPIRDLMTWSGMTIFMNSPNLDVPYHFDHDTNFLLQVRGLKDVYLFDPKDRSVLSEHEIEQFYGGDPMAARYRASLEERATCYRLGPGDAVHHPPLAPHRIRNGNTVSISVAMFYSLALTDVHARVYQVNHVLRRLGLRPRPPAQSASADWTKNLVMRAAGKSRPRTQSEHLFSGIRRILAPARAVKRVAQRVRQLRSA